MNVILALAAWWAVAGFIAPLVGWPIVIAVFVIGVALMVEDARRNPAIPD